MATTAPMQKPVSKIRMMPSRRPLTPLLQPSQSHRLLEALRSQPGWGKGGQGSMAGRGQGCKACHVAQVMHAATAGAAAEAAAAVSQAEAPPFVTCSEIITTSPTAAKAHHSGTRVTPIPKAREKPMMTRLRRLKCSPAGGRQKGRQAAQAARVGHYL